MRLVHLADYASAHAGSFIPMLQAALGGAVQRGWGSVAVLPEEARERDWVSGLEAAGVTVRFTSAERRVEATGVVRDLLAEAPGEPTVLHTHFTRFDLAAGLAARGRREVAVVWHLHTPLAMTAKLQARYALKFGLLGRLADQILCVAPHHYDEVRRWAPRRTMLFTNALDLSGLAAADEEEVRLARAELDLPAEGPVLIHFGWDWTIKGGDLYLGAVRILRERGIEVTAVTRADTDEPRRDAELLGLSHAVRVVRFIEHVRTLHAAGDVLVSSSRSEGVPFAVVESLAAGVPVVATDLPGHHYIAESFPGCRIVAPEPAALADGIAAALQVDRASRPARAEQARSLIEDEMGLDTWMERLFALYGRLT
jgi:L-malate glycosyltransferase